MSFLLKVNPEVLLLVSHQELHLDVAAVLSELHLVCFVHSSSDFLFFHTFFYRLGAALEKKSVRDMAAGLNRLGGKLNTNTYFFIYYNFVYHSFCLVICK